MFLSNNNERMRITSGGNVLIGTTTDAGYKLDVLGDAQIQQTPGTNLSLRLLISGSGAWTIRHLNTGNLDFFDGANSALFVTKTDSNIGVRQSTFGTSATRTLAISTGTAPSSSPADCFQLYSADITAGNAAAHFRTEGGAVIKVYQETTGVAAATLVGGGGTNITDTDTFDGYTLQQVVKALRNQGLLA